MGDDDHGAVAYPVGKRAQHLLFGVLVQAAGRFVEQYHARVAQGKARQADDLLLSAGESGAVFAQLHVQPVRVSLYQALQSEALQCVQEDFVAVEAVGAGEVKVFAQGTEEEARRLRKQRYFAAQEVRVNLPLIDVIEADHAVLRFVQAGGEFEQGGFAAADAAEDGDFFARFDVEREVVQNRHALAFFAVGEGDVFKADFACGWSRGDVLAVGVARLSDGG